MKNKIIKLAAVAVASLALAQTVQATPITGTVNMAGSVTFNSQNLATATAATNISGFVTSGTGTYLSVVSGTTVLLNNFNFASTGSEVISPLWTFVSGGNTYSFSLSSITSISASSSFLQIIGTGLVDVTGYTETAANWYFTVTDSAGGTSGTYTFGFSQSNTSVPDGGTTVLLLGAALSGLALIKRKMTA